MSDQSCPICLEDLLLPLTLPCNHKFCYLCIKGVAISPSGPTCPLCRAVFGNSLIIKPPAIPTVAAGDENKPRWYYEGRNGWWEYDERTSEIVEKAFVETKSKATVSISGNTYEIDFKTKRQYQPNRGTRRRKVTRASRAELGDDRLGIAGVPQPREDPVIDLTDRINRLGR